MNRPPRNPRRSFDRDGREIAPMPLGNMREHGLRAIEAQCLEVDCGHVGSVNVDDLADDVPVPDVALRLRCSRCRSRTVKTIPDWSGGRWGQTYGSGR